MQTLDERTAWVNSAQRRLLTLRDTASVAANELSRARASLNAEAAEAVRQPECRDGGGGAPAA